MQLEQVVPWGRSLAEYRLMFDLTSAEQIRARITEVCPDILAQLETTRDQYVWDSIRDVEHLAQVDLQQHIAGMKALCRVDYQFQKGATRMLVVRSA